MDNKWIVTGSEIESIVMADGEEEDVGKENDSGQRKENMFEGERSKVRREGGVRGRLVRQVATFEPEEIRSPSSCHPADPSQVIYSERISVSANSNGSFCERPVLTSRSGFGNHRQLTIESGSGGANIAGTTFAGRGSTKSTRSNSSKHLVKSCIISHL